MKSSADNKARQEAAEPAANDKLHDLYWNRAELKKRFAALRDEKFDLETRIREEQGATARVQQKMDHLESLLLDREWVHSVAVYYQLRRLHAHCARRLAGFAEQLKQQREKRNFARLVEATTGRQRAAARAAETRLGEVRRAIQGLEADLLAAEQASASQSAIGRILARKAGTGDVETLQDEVRSLQDDEHRLLAEIAAGEGDATPDPEGLSVDDKRSINFMILAYAQELYLEYADDDLSKLARDAHQKSVGAVNYGDKTDCGRILDALHKRVGREVPSPSRETLKRRAKRLKDDANFRYAEDAVPIPASVATLYAFATDGTIRQQDLNVIGENYFGIADVLSR